MSPPPLLNIDDLSISFPSHNGPVKVLDGAGLVLKSGERLVIAGESGSGKSLLCRVILGIQPASATVTGRLEWKGQDLLGLTQCQWRPLRGAQIAMIFQDPTAALNPLLTVGRQIMDAVRAHRRCSRGQARTRAIDVLGLAGLPDPELRLTNYPFELSGGMRQRVAIALALSAGPELIIADEATSNLDVSIQAQIIALLLRLCQELGMALIFVTHDLDLAAQVGGQILVMYAGQPVETGPIGTVLADPCHPYTRGLLRCAPTLRSSRAEPLRPIPGQAPKLGSVGHGAPFRARCPVVVDGVCEVQRASWTEAGPGHRVACNRFALDGRAGLP